MHSNTTLVNVKYREEAELFLNKCNSNTTLVNVKLQIPYQIYFVVKLFKYNTC